MNDSVNILLADDHTIVRQGLALLLGEQKDLKVVGEAIKRTGWPWKKRWS